MIHIKYKCVQIKGTLTFELSRHMSEVGFAVCDTRAADLEKSDSRLGGNSGDVVGGRQK